jgi:hypothetical protein
LNRHCEERRAVRAKRDATKQSSEKGWIASRVASLAVAMTVQLRAISL